MIVGKLKKKTSTTSIPNEVEKSNISDSHLENIMKFIENRDFSGAITFIEFSTENLSVEYSKEIALWDAYCNFHAGYYEKSLEIYQKLLNRYPEDTSINLYISSCHFYMNDFEEAKLSAEKGPQSGYRTRLLFHLAYRLNDAEELNNYHKCLDKYIEDELSLASLYYMRSNFNEAIEIYQRILEVYPDFNALYVYIAMCFYKLDNFEQANEYVDQYLSKNTDSAIALNLKSCTYLRMFDNMTAESQLLQIKKFSSSNYQFVDNIISHNICVFQNGEDGFRILPKLVGLIPEARLNLALLHMRNSNSEEAYNLLQEFTALEINDRILKANVEFAYGQLISDINPINDANNTFQEIGEMETVRDTVPGRQALSASKFIIQDFDQCLKVLNTIEEVMIDCDEFFYNKAMSYAALNKWKDAQKYFLMIKNSWYKREPFYTSWLARCYIFNFVPESAWELYTESTSTEDAKTLLYIIAGDCYSTEQYYYAMKAYDVLSKFELDPDLRKGLIASALGVLKQVTEMKQMNERIQDVLEILGSEPEAEQIYKVVSDYVSSSESYYMYGN